MCPAGFDPIGLDENTNRRTIRLETGNMGGVMFGKIQFGFGGDIVSLNANANQVASEQCTGTLSALKSVAEVTCVRESVNEISGTGSYLISLRKFPQMPFMNNLIGHNGNPHKSLFSCNTSLVDEEEAVGPYCSFFDVEPSEGLPGECGSMTVTLVFHTQPLFFKFAYFSICNFSNSREY